jgi:hypothetical protein
MTDTAEAPHVLARFFEHLTNNTDHLDEELWAENVVIELPFAPLGRPNRLEGRDQFLALARQGRSSIPARFDEVRNVTVHRTATPEMIVAEYELVGTITTNGQVASARFIGVMTVHAGQITHWREYQNTLAMAEALGQR